MDLENENKTENSAVEQNDSSREGYQSAQQGYDNSNYSRAYRSDGRPQRPRFSRTPDRPYSNRSNSSNVICGGYIMYWCGSRHFVVSKRKDFLSLLRTVLKL